jgi:hypothetical protein
MNKGHFWKPPMTSHRKFLISALSCLTAICATSNASQSNAVSAQAPQVADEAKWGTVEGTVLDSDRQPLADATVTAYMEEQVQVKSRREKSIRDVTQYQTNSNGQFSVQLPEGTVWLSAHKKSEGYPYSFFAFYITPGQQFPTVKVRPGETTKGVVVQVGIKAAHLNYEVVDEDGKPVLGGFVFMRPDQPDSPYSTSALAKDDLLVPPTPFRVTFEAKGYKPWHYGGDNWEGKEGVISLKSGEVLNLTIRLQRSQAEVRREDGQSYQ